MSENTKDQKEEISQEEVVTPASDEINAEEAVVELTNEEEIEELNKQIIEQKDKYLRLFADFDNYKKRNAKERLDLLNTAGKDIILSILPTLDDLNRAIASAETATDVSSVRDGFVLVKNKLFNSLSQKGLKPMDSISQDFNPDIHEAITKIPAPTPDLKGKVVDEIERGYTLNEKIIRYAKVVVGE
jgi:molecular chaperone GrpE